MTASGFSVASVTDIGCKRKNNEDSILSIPECGLFCVADGMGGAREGEVASKALTDALQQEFKSRGTENLDLAAKTKLVHEVANQVNTWIKKRAEDRGYAQMGSTLVVGIFDEKKPLRGMAVHAGDSRLYRYRNRALKQFTVDHTVAELTARSDKDLPVQFRGVLTKVIGLCENIELDDTPFDVEPDDLYLLCSDGLTRMLPDQSIQEILCQNETLDMAALAQRFVDEAKKAGGDDNISVILIRTHFDRQNVDAMMEAGELSHGKHGPETVAMASSELDKDKIQDGAKPTTKILDKEISDNDTAEGDTPAGDDERQDVRRDSGKKADRGIPMSSRSQAKDGENTQSKNKLIGRIGIVALILAVWLMASHRNQRGDLEKRVRVVVTSSASRIATGGIARAPLAQFASGMSVGLVTTTMTPIKMSVVPDETTAAIPTSWVVEAMTKQEPPQSVAQVPKSEPVKPPVESPSTNTVNPSSPIGVAQKSNPEKEVESIEKARKALADGLDNAFKTGQWGALQKAIGPWADKLELIEADSAKRATLQAWIKLWDNASKDADLAERSRLAFRRTQAIADMFELELPPMAVMSGDAAERANAYCRSYYEWQATLLKRIAAYVGEEERRMAILGDHVDQYITNLWSFLEGASSANNCGDICKNLEDSKNGIAALKSWTQGPSLDMPLKPDDYPLKDINTVQKKGDAAWDQLYLLMKPLDQQVAFKRTRADEAADLQLSKIAALHAGIVVEREKCSGVRQWRLATHVERIRDLLAEVSNVTLSLRRNTNASK